MIKGGQTGYIGKIIKFTACFVEIFFNETIYLIKKYGSFIHYGVTGKMLLKLLNDIVKELATETTLKWFHHLEG